MERTGPSLAWSVPLGRAAARANTAVALRDRILPFRPVAIIQRQFTPKTSFDLGVRFT